MNIIRTNKVELVDKIELKEFNKYLFRKKRRNLTQIKKHIEKITKEIKVKYVGEIAGINYIVTHVNGLP